MCSAALASPPAPSECAPGPSHWDVGPGLRGTGWGRCRGGGGFFPRFPLPGWQTTLTWATGPSVLLTGSSDLWGTVPASRGGGMAFGTQISSPGHTGREHSSRPWPQPAPGRGPPRSAARASERSALVSLTRSPLATTLRLPWAPPVFQERLPGQEGPGESAGTKGSVQNLEAEISDSGRVRASCVAVSGHEVSAGRLPGAAGTTVGASRCECARLHMPRDSENFHLLHRRHREGHGEG